MIFLKNKENYFNIMAAKSKPLIIGNRYNKLTALKKTGQLEGKSSYIYYLFLCDCGKKVLVAGSLVLSSRRKSCGCLKKTPPSQTHGMSYSRVYKIWQNIKKRCYKKTENNYKNYGGKGVVMCKEWLNEPMCFIGWALKNGYKDNLTIDRINNNGNYEPTNCRWVTKYVQANNTSTNRYISYKDKTKTLAQWAKEYKINRNTLRKRIESNKYSMHEALTNKFREKPTQKEYGYRLIDTEK